MNFIGHKELAKADELMSQLDMRLVTESDISPGMPIVMVGIRQLVAFGKKPERIGDNGTSLIQLAVHPVRPHPTILTREVVYYHQLSDRWNREHFIDKSLFLLSAYDPRIANSSEIRFYVHT